MAASSGTSTEPPARLWERTAPGRRAAVLAVAIIAVAIVGWIDFVTGIEIRVFPLYYFPVGYAAWHVGRRGSIPAALASAIAWLLANALGGLTYTNPAIWAVNTGMQAVSFLLVGGLVAMLREREVAEHTAGGLDSVTGLLNRRAFYEGADRVIARCRRMNAPVTLAYIDLDNFKAVNDTAGHAAGDKLLRDVARQIRLAVRPGDLVGRLGGDEFAILLADVEVADARTALERVRTSLAAAFTDAAIGVTGSVGAAWYSVAPTEVEAMVQRADAAMYAAKHAGRNRLNLEVEPSAHVSSG